MKAWPVLVVLAAVYWAKEKFGIRDAQSFSSDLNESSQSLLQYAPWVLGAAVLLLFIRLIARKDEPDVSEDSKASGK